MTDVCSHRVFSLALPKYRVGVAQVSFMFISRCGELEVRCRWLPYPSNRTRRVGAASLGITDRIFCVHLPITFIMEKAREVTQGVQSAPLLFRQQVGQLVLTGQAKHVTP